MISEEALKALEQTNPDLVARYRAQMAAGNEGVQQAQDIQSYGDVANTAGKILTDYGNSQKNDVVLHNNFANMGKAPTVRAADRPAFDGSTVTAATGRNLANAKAAQATAKEQFMDEDRLTNEVREHGRQDKADAWQGEQQTRQRTEWAGADAVKARKADPNSAESRMAQDAAKKLTGGQDWTGRSAAELEGAIPYLEKMYTVDATERARKDARTDADKNRQNALELRKIDKEDERTYKAGLAEKAATDKKKGQLVEIEDRRTNINQNLDVLDKMIKENGTWEATGSHNQDLNRLVDEVATDMAKLQDPNSVARPSEVEQVKRNLVSAGFSNSNATALKVLANFRKEVDRRADNAYAIRQIPKPANSTSATPPAKKFDWEQ